MYSDLEQENIVKDYFGPSSAEDPPVCPNCGCDLEFGRTVHAVTGFQLKVGCPECAESFVWVQPQSMGGWKQIHLQYFGERHLAEEVARCPYDDCCVTVAEFGDRSLLVGCPYCNRRGELVLDS
jgi:hypothetical protein